MKKLLFIFTLLLCGCTKDCVLESKKNLDVSFTFNIVETGSLYTRSFENSVINNLEYDYPGTIYFCGSSFYVLDLTKDNKLSIQEGTYIVSSLSFSNSDCSSYCNIIPMQKVPLEIETGLECKRSNGISYHGYNLLINESKNYKLDVFINAFIIACKKEDVGYFKWSTDSQQLSNEGLQENNEYYYYILRIPDVLNVTRSALWLTIELGETDVNEKTKINISISKDSRGKYFVLCPNEKNYKTFDFNLTQSWISGI